MDPIQDRYFSAMWRNHFPQRKKNHASRMLLATIVNIVKSRIEVSARPEELADKLSAALARHEIPKEQFDEIERKL